MLDFRMYTFITLSKTLNYTKAAELLCMSQPAVSQHIKYLETYYQVKLFSTDHKQLHLTKQGLLLRKHIITMATDEARLKEIISHKKEGIDHIRFGATKTIGEFILPDKFSQLIENHPTTSISMIVENTRMLLTMLEEGTIDFAFIEGYFKKNDFAYHLISKERFIAVKAKNYQLQKPIHFMEDLLQETLIIREQGSGTREILQRMLDEQNLSLTDFAKTLEIGNIHAIKKLVQQNHGITFLYEAAVHEELQRGLFEILPLEDCHITREFNFITLKNSVFHDVYESFLKDLTS